MDSDRLNRWLTLVANLGVIGGLLLVAVELNQTTNAILGASYQAGAESSVDWNKWVVGTENVIPFSLKFNELGRDALSLEEQYAVETTLIGAFRRHD